MKELLEHFGFAMPFVYAAAAYGVFVWLDNETSDQAKAALASTMRLKDYDGKRIASALVEVFDRLYTVPLLHWRAMSRSALFTIIITAVFAIGIMIGLTVATIIMSDRIERLELEMHSDGRNM